MKFVLHHRSDKNLNDYFESYQKGFQQNTQENGSKSPEKIMLLVGPEGGLSENEINAALGQAFNPLTLGPRVMRTETAPLATLSILQSLWGDLG